MWAVFRCEVPCEQCVVNFMLMQGASGLSTESKEENHFPAALVSGDQAVAYFYSFPDEMNISSHNEALQIFATHRPLTITKLKRDDSLLNHSSATSKYKVSTGH